MTGRQNTAVHSIRKCRDRGEPKSKEVATSKERGGLRNFQNKSSRLQKEVNYGHLAISVKSPVDSVE